MVKPNLDTIVAIATPPGQGGVAVLRVSGSQALDIADAVAAKRPAPRHAVLAGFYGADGGLIDQGLLLYFQAPHSFTGEDVIELHGHGGQVVVQLLLQACLDAGARMAEAGEFSRRAFLNDKIDLAQAEAIADLISARTQAAARAASRSLQGAFSREINTLADELLQLRVYIEAALDFPEEEIDFLDEGNIAARLDAWGARLEALLLQSNSGQLLNDGIDLVLVGKPNAGKSSLLNVLVGEERAIVTEHAGTTRDIVRESIVIEGIPVNVLDTAGLRDDADQIEQEGIRRSRAAMARADIVVWLSDATDIDLQAKADALAAVDGGAAVLHVYNKADLVDESVRVAHQDGVWIAAKTGEGISELKRAVASLLGKREQGEAPFIARERHIRALKACRQHFNDAVAQMHGARMGELIAQDLRLAHDALGEITGKVSADDLLGAIFSSFCIGK